MTFTQLGLIYGCHRTTVVDQIKRMGLYKLPKVEKAKDQELKTKWIGFNPFYDS